MQLSRSSRKSSLLISHLVSSLKVSPSTNVETFTSRFFLTGEIREITPDGAQSTLAILGAGPTTPYPGRRLSGLVVDAQGNIYALLNDVPATAGVWRISPDGTALLFASIPFAAGLNALAFDKRGSLFVSDPFLAAIYRVGSDGSVDVWLTDPLLQGITPSTCGTPF